MTESTETESTRGTKLSKGPEMPEHSHQKRGQTCRNAAANQGARDAVTPPPDKGLERTERRRQTWGQEGRYTAGREGRTIAGRGGRITAGQDDSSSAGQGGRYAVGQDGRDNAGRENSVDSDKKALTKEKARDSGVGSHYGDH